MKFSRRVSKCRWGLASVSIALLCGSVAIAEEQQSPSAATQRLLERNKMFAPRIIKVAPNVYTAIGYQVSTNTMIVGDDGIIIIDPGHVPSQAEAVRREFLKISDKPVKAIIYTHGHMDHTNAAAVFYSEGVQVWARDNYNSEVRLTKSNGYAGGVRPSNTQGFDLKPHQKIGIGVAIPPAKPPSGDDLMLDGTKTKKAARGGKVDPTHQFSSERQLLEIAGVRLELVAAPGETDDQLYVWLPEEKVVFAGDNFYQSWPNTYPLRGTARRSVRDWVASLSKMVEEEPEMVVGGHTAPMSDATTVLTNYRDGLQWVLNKTVEGAKKHLTPDELVEYAALPEHLADLDYLANYYGSRWGTVRDIYAQDLGWFDGNVLNLHREPPARRAQAIANWLGGVKGLSSAAHASVDRGDSNSAAELAYYWSILEPDSAEPVRLLAKMLRAMAVTTLNAPRRNYTLSSANRFEKRANELEQKQ